jgi:hypothetical protein
MEVLVAENAEEAKELCLALQARQALEAIPREKGRGLAVWRSVRQIMPKRGRRSGTTLENTGTSPALCGPTVVLWNLRVWSGERRALKQGRERRTAVKLSRGRKGGQNPQVCVCRCWARQDLLQKLQKKRFYRSEPC